jgi:succinate-semialdehyde dehydrogenase/glutarate-semialdehyde dehydrogenase
VPAPYPKVGLLIDGKWTLDRPACMQVRNPSNDAVMADVPRASSSDLEHALRTADRGFRVWKATAPDARAKVLRKASELLRARLEAIAEIITLELGKPLADSRYEVERACTILEWDAAEAQRLYGRINPSGPGMQQLVLRQPIGPVAAFTPWNAPLGSPARKLSGALAAGCSVILKAAEETPGAACLFAQCLLDAGLPPEVLTLVFGDGREISTRLIESPLVRMVTFTGSVAVGKELSRLAASHMKPALMELGGHAPVVIAEDVDAVTVGKLAAAAKVRMAGQICVSPTRFIVHRGVYKAFVDSFAASMRDVRVGDGFSAGVQMGPLANARRLSAVERLVEDAKASGAKVAAGGARIGDKGCFFAPTVLADVPLQAKVMTEEPFGPLAPCVAVSTLEEGIATANSLSVGLAGYAFTNSLHEAEILARELECGILSINHFGGPAADMPFGGVKESGIGREGGSESLHAYTVTKMVSQRTARV